MNTPIHWPPEIDIHEFFGGNTVYHATIHSADAEEENNNIRIDAPTATTEFNIYGLHWRDDDRLDFYYNNVLQGSLNEPDPYDHKVMIINFGIHGPKDPHDWLGNASNNVYPVYFDIDWVRVWRKK
jgi:beta-glucanase (GH16 family)